MKPSMNRMKKLVLKSTTFLWSCAGEGLLYGTDSHSSFRFHLQDSLIKAVCDQLMDVRKLYTALYDEDNTSTAFDSFLQGILDNELGAVYDPDVKAFALRPVLKVTHGAGSLHLWNGSYSDQPVLNYLKNLRVFLGGTSDGHDWFRQTVYPMSSEYRLSADRLMFFLNGCDPLSLSRIDLVISEWEKDRISAFSKAFFDSPLKERVGFFFAHPDPGFHHEILDSLLAGGYRVTQLCPPDESLTNSEWDNRRQYQLLLRSGAEYDRWLSLLHGNATDNYDFVVIAEDNVDFFRANVFLSEEEILSQKLSKKDIFRHQALNVNQFGVLYVFPDGTVHSAPDAPAVGTLEDSVHQVIIRELEENHAWRQTRREMESCRNCVYHDLCPSPTAYERVLGVPACTVKP